jgi:hypothetical protein
VTEHTEVGQTQNSFVRKSLAILAGIGIAALALFLMLSFQFGVYRHDRKIRELAELESLSSLHAVVVPEMIRCLTGRERGTPYYCESMVGAAAIIRGQNLKDLRVIFEQIERVRVVTIGQFIDEMNPFAER